VNSGNAAGVLGVMACALVIGVVIGTLVGAVLLRAGIALYNRFAGGREAPGAVPEPAFGKAMGIMFVTFLVNGVVNFVMGLMLGAGAVAAGSRMGGVNIVAQLVSIPVSLLVMATMLMAMLPTTFGRGILVTLCYMLVVLFVVVVLGVVFGGIALLVFGLAGNH